MNDFTQNSQGPSAPKSKLTQLTEILNSIDTHIGAVKSNLFRVSIAFDEFEQDENPTAVVKALNDMSVYHLNVIIGEMDKAISLYNFPQYTLVSKVATNLIYAIESQNSASMNNSKEIESSYLYGLYFYADQLQGVSDSAWKETCVNKEKLNG